MTLDRAQAEHFPSLAQLRPPRLVTTVAWLILLGVLLVLAILFVPWQQTAQGGGQVTTLSAQDRARDVSSLVSGRVAEFYVRDGDHVRAGDPSRARRTPRLRGQEGQQRARTIRSLVA